MNQLVPWTPTQNTRSLLENPPQPAGHCQLAGAITESSKGYSTIWQASCFTMVGNVVRSTGRGPLPPFLP